VEIRQFTIFISSLYGSGFIIIINPFSILYANHELFPVFSFIGLTYLVLSFFNCTCRRSSIGIRWSAIALVFHWYNNIVFHYRACHNIYTPCNCLFFIWDFFLNIIYDVYEWRVLQQNILFVSCAFSIIYKIMLKTKVDMVCSKK